MIQEFWIESFIDYDDAVLWVDSIVLPLIDRNQQDIKIELTLIDGKWRAGVSINNRQMEFEFDR